MKTLLVPAFIALFALPAAAGEMPEASPAPTAGTAAVTVTTGDVAATVVTGEIESTDSKAYKHSMPSYSGYGGGCDRGHASTEAMLIN